MIPTIVIRAAHDELDTRERFRSAGAVDYLLKPLQETPLIFAINAATGAPARCRKRGKLIGRSILDVVVRQQMRLPLGGHFRRIQRRVSAG